MANRQTKTGRSKFKGTFALIPNDLINSEAWRHTSLAARALLVEIASLYNGANNGRLGLSVRQGAERLQCSKDTASRAFRELREHGVVETTYEGKFKEKELASEWRVTWKRCDRTGALPSSAYRLWRPPLAPSPRAGNASRFKRSQSDLRDTTVRSQGHSTP